VRRKLDREETACSPSRQPAPAHLIDQRGSFQAEAGCGSGLAAYPIAFFECPMYVISLGFFQSHSETAEWSRRDVDAG
jgi:hypothetical protein